ncbi:MAG: hypothetical protein ACOCP8_04340 [archaeon]
MENKHFKFIDKNNKMSLSDKFDVLKRENYTFKTLDSSDGLNVMNRGETLLGVIVWNKYDWRVYVMSEDDIPFSVNDDESKIEYISSTGDKINYKDILSNVFIGDKEVWEKWEK